MAGRALRQQAKAKRAQQAPGGDFGQIPHSGIPSNPIPKEDTIALAKGGVDVNRGNSNEQPLSPFGEAAAVNTGEQLAQKAPGMLAPVKQSASARAQQSAAAIEQATGTPGAPPDPKLESWAQGNLEGQPEQNVKKIIGDLVRKHPDYKIPGQGAMSTRPGESFNDFRMRVLPVVRSAMQELAHDPSKYIPIVLHSQTIKLIEAWMDAGMPDDFSVNPEAMLKDKTEAPGAVERLYPVPEHPGWRKEAISLDGKQPLPPPPGVLLIRHGMTESNRENYEQNGKKQDAIAELAKHVKSGDFGRARAFAHKASTEMGVSDDDINSVIDSSVPSADEAANFPHHRLLAAASVAHGTDKFPAYASLLQQRFSNLQGLPPDAQNQLRSHLGALGVNV